MCLSEAFTPCNRYIIRQSPVNHQSTTSEKNTMLRLLKRIGVDILSGKNIETYVVTIVAVIVAFLSVIEDVVPLDLQMAALLAAVALLVFKTADPETPTIDLDTVLQDRQSFQPFREFIKGGTELWIYGPSAVTAMANSPDIEREILERGGSVQVLMQDPNERVALDILHQQLDVMSHLLESDIARSVSILETMKARHSEIDYRFLPYSPGFSLVIVDPDGRDARLIIEFFGFEGQSINDRMHIEIHRNQSNYWFEYWASQYITMWEKAREP